MELALARAPRDPRQGAAPDPSGPVGPLPGFEALFAPPPGPGPSPPPPPPRRGPRGGGGGAEGAAPGLLPGLRRAAAEEGEEGGGKMAAGLAWEASAPPGWPLPAEGPPEAGPGRGRAGPPPLALARATSAPLTERKTSVSRLGQETDRAMGLGPPSRAKSALGFLETDELAPGERRRRRLERQMAEEAGDSPLKAAPRKKKPALKKLPRPPLPKKADPLAALEVGHRPQPKRLPAIAMLPDPAKLAGMARGLGLKIEEYKSNAKKYQELQDRLRAYHGQDRFQNHSRNFIQHNQEAAARNSAQRALRLQDLTNRKVKRNRRQKEAKQAREERAQLATKTLVAKITAKERQEEAQLEAEKAARLAAKRRQKQLDWLQCVTLASRLDALARGLKRHRRRRKKERERNAAARRIQRAFRAFHRERRRALEARAAIRIQRWFRSARRALLERRRRWAAGVLVAFLREQNSQAALSRVLKQHRHAVNRVRAFVRGRIACFQAQRALVVLQWERWETARLRELGLPERPASKKKKKRRGPDPKWAKLELLDPPAAGRGGPKDLDSPRRMSTKVPLARRASSAVGAAAVVDAPPRPGRRGSTKAAAPAEEVAAFARVPAAVKAFCVARMRQVKRDELAEALARWEEDVEEFELEFMVEENMRRATAVVNGEFYDEAAGERRFRAAAPPRPHLRTLWSALDLEQCHAAGRAIADACFISRAGGQILDLEQAEAIFRSRRDLAGPPAAAGDGGAPRGAAPKFPRLA